MEYGTLVESTIEKLAGLEANTLILISHVFIAAAVLLLAVAILKRKP